MCTRTLVFHEYGFVEAPQKKQFVSESHKGHEASHYEVLHHDKAGQKITSIRMKPLGFFFAFFRILCSKHETQAMDQDAPQNNVGSSTVFQLSKH